MNILDEDITSPERERLRAAKPPFRQIGRELGRHGMKDRNEVIPLLHRLRRFSSSQSERSRGAMAKTAQKPTNQTSSV